MPRRSRLPGMPGTAAREGQEGREGQVGREGQEVGVAVAVEVHNQLVLEVVLVAILGTSIAPDAVVMDRTCTTLP